MFSSFLHSIRLDVEMKIINIISKNVKVYILKKPNNNNYYVFRYEYTSFQATYMDSWQCYFRVGDKNWKSFYHNSTTTVNKYGVPTPHDPAGYPNIDPMSC